MPLVGAKCPYRKKNIPFGECLECADTGNQPCGYPYGFLSAVSATMTHPRDEIHVTDLTGCLRRAYFTKISNYYENPAQWIAPALGIIIHKGLEGFRPPGSEAEIQLSTITTSGIKIVGRVDLYLYNGKIIDYKTKRHLLPSRLPTLEHEMQMNVYHWLLVNNDYYVTGATLVYLALRGATRCDTCHCLLEHRDDGQWECPKCHKTWKEDEAHMGMYQANVRLRPLSEIEQWIDTRARILQGALDSGFVPPKIGRRWLCDYCSFVEQCQAMDSIES